MIQQASLDELRTALEEAWCRDTSASPERWRGGTPSLGQCAVTALVLQDYLGGDLIRNAVNNESHYWLRLPDGRDVDLTLKQFDLPVETSPPETRNREYVLSYKSTSKRYSLLRTRVAEKLESHFE